FPKPEVLNKQYILFEITNPLVLYQFSTINNPMVFSKASLFKIKTIFTTDTNFVRYLIQNTEHVNIMKKNLEKNITSEEKLSEIEQDKLSLDIIPNLRNAFSDLDYSVSLITEAETSLYLRLNKAFKKELNRKFILTLLISFFALVAWDSIFIYNPSSQLSNQGKFIVSSLLGINSDSTLFYIVINVIALLIASLIAVEAFMPNALGITVSFLIGTLLGFGGLFPLHDPNANKFFVYLDGGSLVVCMIFCSEFVILMISRKEDILNYGVSIISELLGFTLGIGLLYGVRNSLNIVSFSFIGIFYNVIIPTLALIILMIIFGAREDILGFLGLILYGFGAILPIYLFVTTFSVKELVYPGSLFINLGCFLMFLKLGIIYIKSIKRKFFAKMIVSLIETTKPSTNLVIQPMKSIFRLLHPYFNKYVEAILPTSEIEIYQEKRPSKNPLSMNEIEEFTNIVVKNSKIVLFKNHWLILHKDVVFVFRDMFPGEQNFITVGVEDYKRIIGIILRTAMS
ncbi:MAG: hypothetical protein ACTSUF_03070, partial [Candidatus Heimdallarchaeaceae archaeon]